MSAHPIAPVLARIDAIRARFEPNAPTVRLADAAAPSVDFESHYRAADAAADAAGVAPTAVPDRSQLPGAVAPGRAAGVAAAVSGALTGRPGDPPVTATDSAPDVAPVRSDTPFAGLFDAAGVRHGVPPDLLAAVGWVESRYQTDALSPHGAQGVMQLMPFVADHLGVDAWDPAQAIDGAARLLADHRQRFGSWELALAAYHAGPGAVSQAGDRIPTDRTAEYVRAVGSRMEEL